MDNRTLAESMSLDDYIAICDIKPQRAFNKKNKQRNHYWQSQSSDLRQKINDFDDPMGENENNLSIEETSEEYSEQQEDLRFTIEWKRRNSRLTSSKNIRQNNEDSVAATGNFPFAPRNKVRVLDPQQINRECVSAQNASYIISKATDLACKNFPQDEESKKLTSILAELTSICLLRSQPNKMQEVENNNDNTVKSKYNYKIQKEISAIQQKPLYFKCPGIEVISCDGNGINSKINPKSTDISMNQRFA